jgi:hypothetical protein
LTEVSKEPMLLGANQCLQSMVHAGGANFADVQNHLLKHEVVPRLGYLLSHEKDTVRAESMFSLYSVLWLNPKAQGLAQKEGIVELAHQLISNPNKTGVAVLSKAAVLLRALVKDNSAVKKQVGSDGLACLVACLRIADEPTVVAAAKALADLVQNTSSLQEEAVGKHGALAELKKLLGAEQTSAVVAAACYAVSQLADHNKTVQNHAKELGLFEPLVQVVPRFSRVAAAQSNPSSASAEADEEALLRAIAAISVLSEGNAECRDEFARLKAADAIESIEESTFTESDKRQTLRRGLNSLGAGSKGNVSSVTQRAKALQTLRPSAAKKSRGKQELSATGTLRPSRSPLTSTAASATTTTTTTATTTTTSAAPTDTSTEEEKNLILQQVLAEKERILKAKAAAASTSGTS